MISLSDSRRAIEAAMTDTCTIRETATTPVDEALDPATLKPLPVDGSAIVYSGTCFATSTFSGEDLVTPGSAPSELGDYWLFLPASAPLPVVGAEATIDTSRFNPSLVGLVVTVVSEDLSSLDLCRAVRCQAISTGRPLHGG